MEVALFPADATEATLAALTLAGIKPVGVPSLESITQEKAADWSVLVVELGEEPMRRLRRLEGLMEESGVPVLVVAEPDQLPLLERSQGLTDFVTTPPGAGELGTRIRRIQGVGEIHDVIVFKELQLNPLTYQATLAGIPLDLTFMEYELLKYLVENQGRVWTREQLLSKVWGYDYFGGARTVDVHIRRVRAKLGEERAGWITTVRSVGYRWG